MNTPQWFSNPNAVLTEQDIKEVLEYEEAQSELLRKEGEKLHGT